MSDRYRTYPRTADALGVLDDRGLRPLLGSVSGLGFVDDLGLYGAAAPAVDNLLLEDGNDFLLEDGSFLLLES